MQPSSGLLQNIEEVSVVWEVRGGDGRVGFCRLQVLIITSRFNNLSDIECLYKTIGLLFNNLVGIGFGLFTCH